MDIFLGYDHADRDCAERVAEKLNAQGWNVFWDIEVPVGKSWRQFIHQKLKVARCIVVLWSKHSVESGYVIEEAEVGKREKKLVPVLIDDVDIPFGFGGIQSANLVDWREDATDQHFVRLFRDIKAMIGESPAFLTTKAKGDDEFKISGKASGKESYQIDKRYLAKDADHVFEIRKDFRVRMTEAIAFYYEKKLTDSSLFVPKDLSILSKKDWLPDQPLEIKEIDARLKWEDKGQPALSYVSQFNLAYLMENNDREGKLYNGRLYRYLGGDGKQYKFCSSSYYEFLNSCEYLSYELAKAFKDNRLLFDLLQNGGRAELEQIARFFKDNEQLIPERAEADPDEFDARITAFGTCALVILKRSKKPARFIINVRSRDLSETPSLLHVIPAGTFQPNSIDDRFHDFEFSFTENIIREFTEELLEDKLLRADGPHVFTFDDTYPKKGKEFRKKVIEDDNYEMLYLGTVIDPINLKPEILTVFMVHEAYLKLIVGDEMMSSWETHQDERTKQKELMYYDFTKKKLVGLINRDEFVPTGKAHLSLALKHYDYLISKLIEL